ncbi:MAG: hypothetical protein E6K96_07400 [Thaumarchaeota archaeon]|nr:MAG: hypothetical protein E6K96_07400 [Nitrososphaerota archaeon]
MGKSAAALGLLLVLYIVTSAYLGALTTEPQARGMGFGAPAPANESGGGDRTQVFPEGPQEAISAPGGPSGDPTVTIMTNLPGVSATVDGANLLLPKTFNWTAGSQHTVSVLNVTSPAADTRETFLGWTGYAASASPELSFVVNGDGQLTANYVKQRATLLGPRGQVSVPVSGQVWLDANSNYSLVGVTWSNITVGPAVQSYTTLVTKDSTTSYKIPLTIYRDTIKVTDIFGLPFRGASVTITGANGSETSRLTDSKGVVSVELPLGTYSADVLYFGVRVSSRDSSLGSHNVDVSLPLNYPTILALVVSLGTYGDYLARGGMKRRQQDAEPFLTPESS